MSYLVCSMFKASVKILKIEMKRTIYKFADVLPFLFGSSINKALYIFKGLVIPPYRKLLTWKA